MRKPIGSHIKDKFDQSGMTVTAFADRLNTSRNNVYDIFQRESIDTKLLSDIGEILGFNFFTLFVEAAPTDQIVSKPFRISVEVEITREEAIKINLSEKIAEALAPK